MLLAHERLAVLWTLQKSRSLTAEEMEDMNICLQANTIYCWEMARIKQLSLMASETNDVSLQHEVYTQMEELQLTGKVIKRNQ